VNRDLRQLQSDAGEQDKLDTMDIYFTSDTLFQLLEEKILKILVAGQEHQQRAAANQ